MWAPNASPSNLKTLPSEDGREVADGSVMVLLQSIKASVDGLKAEMNVIKKDVQDLQWEQACEEDEDYHPPASSRPSSDGRVF